MSQPMYLLINLALGGNNGGSLSNFKNPQRYYIDYVRVYSKTSSTGIRSLTLDKNQDSYFYALDGRRSVRPHSKGIYIYQGKKVVIR